MSQERRILIVDDEAIIRDFIAEVLEEYDIEQAFDGQDAIEKIPAVNPDLIITDIKMPRKGGEEVIKFAKEFNNDLPIIVVTGYTSLEIASKCVKMGALGFLSKPFTIAQLREEVNKCLEV